MFHVSTLLPYTSGDAQQVTLAIFVASSDTRLCVTFGYNLSELAN